MKIYEIERPIYKTGMVPDVKAQNVYYANATNVEEQNIIVCKKCMFATEFIKPTKRIIEWLPGSNIVGDFTWVGRLIGEVVITKRVKDSFEKVTRGL